MSIAISGAEPRRRVLGRDWLTLAAIWLVLATVPLWLPFLGGYTALAARVLVFAWQPWRSTSCSASPAC